LGLKSNHSELAGAAAGAGFLAGALALVRANALLFLPVAAAWMFVVARRREGARAAHSLVFLAAAVVAILPATIRNVVVSGEDQPLKLDSRKPTVPLEQFTMKEGRYAMLAQADPGRAKMLSKVAQAAADSRWQLYEQVAGVHRNVPDDYEQVDSGGAAKSTAPKPSSEEAKQ